MNPRSSDYKRDIKLVDNTLLNLIKGRLFMLIAVSIIVLGVLYFVAKKILSFGRNLDYSILNNTAVEVAVDYLEQYDVYFWWAVVLIIALFVLSFINNFVRKSLDSFSHSNIPMPVSCGTHNARITPRTTPAAILNIKLILFHLFHKFFICSFSPLICLFITSLL